jgi:protein tyrosine phosphatase
MQVISQYDDYVIKGPKSEDNKMFIATQGPLHSTFSSFWKMIYNKKIFLVIMLCKMEEDSRVTMSLSRKNAISTGLNLENP